MALESFIFVTEKRKTRLVLAGELISWDDEAPTGITEHRVNKQGGALHQDQGSPPRRWAFKCLITARMLEDDGNAPSLSTAFKDRADALTNDPFGVLTHPRLGTSDAVCEGVTSQEQPGEESEAIYYTVKFVEDGLRQPLTKSLGAATIGTVEKLSDLRRIAASDPPEVTAQVGVISSAVDTFVLVSNLVQTGASLYELTVSLRSVQDAVAALPATASYRTRAAAALLSASALDAVRSAQLGRPRIIPYLVEGSISLAELSAALYGGPLAKPFAKEIRSLNRIPTPYRISPLTVLLLSDPEEVRRNAR